VVLNVGTGRNHSVLDMAKAAAKTATPLVEFQAGHPADVPETLASITAVGAKLGWQPRIIFPDGPIP
jgi:nucleoside-diphosphate-sugar epimerase